MTALLCLVLSQGLAVDLNPIAESNELRGATVGIVVTETNGQVLYERNPNFRMLPASNQKLFTCAFALKRLGPSFRPSTRFWKEPNSLVVRSEGDPTISYQTFKALGRRLNPGRKTVDVIEAYRVGYPGSWQLGDLPNRYAAPIYALTVDRGSLELWNVNGKPELRPAQFDIAIAWTRRNGPVSDVLDVFHHRLTLKGALPKETKRLDTLGIPDTDYEVAGLLGKGVRFDLAAPSRKPDFVFTGDSITKTMQTCLQMSDNNLAENLLFMAASRDGDLVDPYHETLPKLSAFLRESVGLTADDVSPDDGCGMSRHNLVTPNAIARILGWSLKQPTGALWRTLLDHPGSGTLKSRLAGVPFQGKTGTLEHVSALSGYLEAGGRTVIVSIMLNNYLCATSVAKNLEDLLVKKIKANLSGGTSRALK